ncbi:MAG: hypothetical protein K8R52_11030 [Bacteroidales bacterium]|nr:hypothetical protein [Bacteroidales bacterium]
MNPLKDLWDVRSAKNSRVTRPHTLFWGSADRNVGFFSDSNGGGGDHIALSLGATGDVFYMAGEETRIGSLDLLSGPVHAPFYHWRRYRYAFPAR